MQKRNARLISHVCHEKRTAGEFVSNHTLQANQAIDAIGLWALESKNICGYNTWIAGRLFNMLPGHESMRSALQSGSMFKTTVWSPRANNDTGNIRQISMRVMEIVITRKVPIISFIQAYQHLLNTCELFCIQQTYPNNLFSLLREAWNGAEECHSSAGCCEASFCKLFSNGIYTSRGPGKRQNKKKKKSIMRDTF